MKNLWAPWRMEYILKEKRGEKEPCIFCSRVNQSEDQKNLILHRGDHSFIIMNRYPYNNGHLMVVPFRHTGELAELEKPEITELFHLINLSMEAMNMVMIPHGFNIGMNLGRVAGAGIEDHLHFHIVPRWNGDTNFMPVLADTKVVSEALDKTYDKLFEALQKIAGK